MSQPKSVPTSLLFFRFLSSVIFFIMVGLVIGALYGPMGIVGSFTLGLLGALFFKVFLETQTDYIYWWLRILWELNVTK